ncbi:MAG: hypothetical protein IKT40_03445 [Bacilli bacterium]|nr:hypothetical protein [Bacilli bacterium]
MKTIKIIKNYYDEDYEIFKTDEINIEQGITVLVGCNGYGKSTFLKFIKDQLEEENIPCMSYGDMEDGRSDALSKAFLMEDFGLGSTLIQSSEGEKMMINLGTFFEKIHPFLTTGKDDFHKNPFKSIFEDEKEETEISNERFILLDSIDSGTSINNMVQLLNVLDLVIKDAKKLGKELYIIITTNAYELARNNKCLDVVNGEYITFKDYEEYREFVLKTSEEKEKK